MATDHYTRLGIEKEKFDELNKQKKEELVDKQFKKLAPKGLARFIFALFPKSLAPKKLQLLESARDILKNEVMRNDYDYLRNPKLKLVGEDVTYLKLKELKEPLKSIARKREERLLSEQIGKKQEELEKIKDGRETQKYETTNKIITYLESELKGLMEKVLEMKATRIDDLNLKLKGAEDKDASNNIKGEITKIANEHSKLLKELNGLNNKSEQPKKEESQQAKVQQATPDAAKNVGNKVAKIPLTNNVQKLVSNAPKSNQSAPPKPPRIKPTHNTPIIPLDPRMQELVNRYQRSGVDGVKLNTQQTPPLKPPRLSVLSKQIEQQEKELVKMETYFQENLKKAGIDIKGMSDKEIQNKLRYTGTLPLQYGNIQSKKSELGDLKNTKLELMEAKTHEIIKERKSVIQDSEKWNKLTNELKDINAERSKLDIELDKLQPKPDINNNTQGKFAWQTSQERQKGNNRTI